MTLDSGSDQPTNNLGGGRGLFRAIRWVIVIILLALGFVLIQRGQYLFGWIIVGLAVLRVVLIFASGRRQAFGYRGSGKPIRELLRGFARYEFDVAAVKIGVSLTQLRNDFDQGKSIAEIATASGVSEDSVINAIVADMSARIDQAKTEGRVSADLAAQAKSRLPMWVARLANGHKGEFRRRRI